MRIKILIAAALLLIGYAGPARALSCAEGDKNFIPDNELIVRAKILSIRHGFYIPFIQDPQDRDEIITFEILDSYKAPVEMPDIFEARFTRFFQTWGPDLKEGQEGEYLFGKEDGQWTYQGPGGCTFVSDGAWEALRARKQPR